MPIPSVMPCTRAVAPSIHVIHFLVRTPLSSTFRLASGGLGRRRCACEVAYWHPPSSAHELRAMLLGLLFATCAVVAELLCPVPSAEFQFPVNAFGLLGAPGGRVQPRSCCAVATRSTNNRGQLRRCNGDRPRSPVCVCVCVRVGVCVRVQHIFYREIVLGHVHI